jgi:hypothetical protein
MEFSVQHITSFCINRDEYSGVDRPCTGRISDICRIGMGGGIQVGLARINAETTLLAISFMFESVQAESR